ncbi:hypothetical protein [Halosimplex sp. J119]
MKQLIGTISVFVAFAVALLFINVWFVASSGACNIGFTVNAFGEQWLEYILWLFVTPLLVLGFHYTLEAAGYMNS